MESAQDNVNWSFGLRHDLENKVISHEPKVADTLNFQKALQKVKNAVAKIGKISSFENVVYNPIQLPAGDIPHVRERIKTN